MHSKSLLAAAVLAALGSTAAHAAVDLIAVGTVSGQYQDFSTATSAALENGIAGNKLGGMGSGLAYAGCNTFLALPDRGPNAQPYNSAIDETASYIPRFHTVHLALAPADASASLPFILTPFVTDTTLLSSLTPLAYGSGTAYGVPNGRPALNPKNHAFYFSGRSDNYAADKLSTDPNNGRLDPEGIRISNDGESVFISDEYGPYLYQFDRDSGRRVRAFKLPEKFAISHLSPVGNTEISGNITGRVANKGMEGLAISPDDRYLFGAMQSPLIQDGGTDAAFTRIVRVDIHSGAITEYAYELTNIGSAAKPKYGTISEILAINDHEFLVDERDGKGFSDNSSAAFKRLYRIDLNGAANVGSVIGAANLAGKAVSKTLFLDVVTTLNAHGFAAEDIPAKLEGIAFGPDVTIAGVAEHTLFVSNDNDYTSTVTDSNHPAGADNPNRWFVYAFTAAELPHYIPQPIESRHSCSDDHRPWDDWFRGPFDR
jgi:hypothetical protein